MFSSTLWPRTALAVHVQRNPDVAFAGELFRRLALVLGAPAPGMRHRHRRRRSARVVPSTSAPRRCCPRCVYSHVPHLYRHQAPLPVTVDSAAKLYPHRSFGAHWHAVGVSGRNETRASVLSCRASRKSCCRIGPGGQEAETPRARLCRPDGLSFSGTGGGYFGGRFRSRGRAGPGGSGWRSARHVHLDSVFTHPEHEDEYTNIGVSEIGLALAAAINDRTTLEARLPVRAHAPGRKSVYLRRGSGPFWRLQRSASLPRTGRGPLPWAGSFCRSACSTPA